MFRNYKMVVSLSASNVKDHINILKSSLVAGNTLVFVHAHWCPYTVSFYGTWRNLKAKLVGLTNLTVIEIDDEALMSLRTKHTNTYKKLADYIPLENQYKIFFPTIVLYVDGVRYKYEDERTVKDLTEFVHKHAFGKMQKRHRAPSRKVVPKQVATRPNDAPKKVVPRVQPKTPTTRTKTAKRLQQEIDDAFKRLLLM
jgi:hypothetical protein